jgi:hypothetical protein
MEKGPSFVREKQGEYTEEELKEEMEKFRNDVMGMYEENDKHKEEVRNWNDLELFNKFQNNFWGRLDKAVSVYAIDGSIKPGEEHWAEMFEGQKVSGEERRTEGVKTVAEMYRDLRKILTEPEYASRIIDQRGKTTFFSGGSMTEDELNMVKQVFKKMRSLGYSFFELRR